MFFDKKLRASQNKQAAYWIPFNKHAAYSLTRNKQLPAWVSGTRAALFQDDIQVNSGVDKKIQDAKHTPAMWQYLIHRSHKATGRKKSWDEDTYETIDWKHFG
jgi:hypothetical protein